jgi:anti-sigma B factor antagonist
VNIKAKTMDPGITVLDISGNIRMGADCQRLAVETEQLITRQALRVIFDFSQLDYLDSAAIGTLVNCLTKLRRAGGDLRLAGLKPMVAGVFKLTKIDTIIKIFPSVAAAAQDFPAPSAPGA